MIPLVFISMKNKKGLCHPVLVTESLNILKSLLSSNSLFPGFPHRNSFVITIIAKVLT